MKKLLSIITIAALLLSACGRTLKVEPVKQLTVEYGDKLDNSKLYDASKSDKDIKVSKIDGFDSLKVGNEKVKVTFTDKDGKNKAEKEIMIDIKDTKAPVIVLDKDEVSIEQGNNIDLTKNIKSIKDPVDGDIKYSKSKVDKDGYYIDKGKLDTEKPNTYEVRVIAYDKNKNKAEKFFKVKVTKRETAKKPVEQQTAEAQIPNTTIPNNTGNGNSGNGNSGNGNSGSGNKGQTPSKPQNNSGNGSGNTSTSTSTNTTPPVAQSTPPANACVPDGTYKRVGNSGKVFNSEKEADDWAQNYILNQQDPWKYHGYSAITVVDSCGNERNDLWTIGFH